MGRYHRNARGKLLVRVADLIAENAERIAAIETRDNGKLITEMTAQLRYIPEWFRYFGGRADKIEGSVLPGMFAFTRHEPLGAIAAIVPWNSPLLLLTWKLAPLLAAGNTVVIKPSEHASASTLEFVKLFEHAVSRPALSIPSAGMPADVGAPLVSHPDVAKIAFTGGEPGGIAVYRAAAETEDRHARTGRQIGQTSSSTTPTSRAPSTGHLGHICGQRADVHRRLAPPGTSPNSRPGRRWRGEACDKRPHRQPALAETQVGPITTEAQREKVLSYLDIAHSEGAECVLGGGKPAALELTQGWFVEPSIFTGVSNRCASPARKCSGRSFGHPLQRRGGGLRHR